MNLSNLKEEKTQVNDSRIYIDLLWDLKKHSHDGVKEALRCVFENVKISFNISTKNVNFDILSTSFR